MAVSFLSIKNGKSYSRPTLAKEWGYAGYQAISRGVVTPKGDNKIVLFVTEEKQASAQPYKNLYSNGRLEWDGPTDHFAEKRMISAREAGDEIHLFHRKRHHSDFIYLGKIAVKNYVIYSDKPSAFIFVTIP